MSRITFAGAWAYLWGVWHLLWLFGLVWLGVVQDPELVKHYFRALYSAFLPMELMGLKDLLDDPKDRELAKTKSQWAQALAQFGKPGSPRWLGWRAAAGMIGVLDGILVGWILWDVFPPLGICAGLGLALWLAPHFAARDVVG